MTNSEKREERKLRGAYKQKYCKKKKIKKVNVRKGSKYATFVQAIRTRGNGQCEYCCNLFPDPNDLIVHHIGMVKDEPHNACNEKNGVLICRLCHAEIHPWLRKCVS